MRAILLSAFSVVALLANQAATPVRPRPAATKPAAAKPKPAAAKPTTPAREPGVYVTIVTTAGTLTGRLFEKEAPITVKNFMDLAEGKKEFTDPATGQRTKRPFYNGLIFHRVIPGFMIQTGDPTGTGTQGSDPIPDEIVPTLHFDQPGRFGMANKGPQTGSSQFFITETEQSRLDGHYTIFGQLDSGLDVLKKIANVPRDERDHPDNPTKIVRVTFTRVNAPAPAKPKPAARKPVPAKRSPTAK